MDIDPPQAQVFLATYYGIEPPQVTLVGEGAWSRCFGYRLGDAELVIRFGRYIEDFRKDQQAGAYAGPGLPIPKVHDLGRAFDGHYAIAARVHGEPLERLSASQWRATVPSLVSALEAMRLADLPDSSGVGSWGVDGQAPFARWSEHLLAVADDSPSRRIHGWRERLATSPQGEAAFDWGYDRLKQVASDSIPRGLVHADLINRNVLVDNEKIMGVLDWGCSLYGDPLYDLAWLEFWAPWHPQLDMACLRSEIGRHWQDVGYRPHDMEARLAACYLHIGLDHLAYNAFLGDWGALSATAERMRALVTEAQA